MIGLKDGEESSFLFSFLALTLYVTAAGIARTSEIYIATLLFAPPCFHQSLPLTEMGKLLLSHSSLGMLKGGGAVRLKVLDNLRSSLLIQSVEGSCPQAQLYLQRAETRNQDREKASAWIQCQRQPLLLACLELQPKSPKCS